VHSPRQPQHAQLAAYRSRLDAHLDNTRDALRTHDLTVAAEHIAETITVSDEIDLAIALLLVTGHADNDAAATALIYQHLSRIAAHLTNVLTSVACRSTSSTPTTGETVSAQANAAARIVGEVSSGMRSPVRGRRHPSGRRPNCGRRRVVACVLVT
jgi:hypothetical protein